MRQLPPSNSGIIMPGKKFPGGRSVPVFLREAGSTEVKKIFTISILKKDGGIMIFPVMDTWADVTYSRLVVPEDGGLHSDPSSEIVRSSDDRPKLHYHRSGMTSVQPSTETGGQDRKVARLPSVDMVDRVQIFSATMKLPVRLPAASDAGIGIYVMGDLLIAQSLGVSGVLYRRDGLNEVQLRQLTLGEPIIQSPSSDSTFIIDLSGYGSNTLLCISMIFSPTPLPDASSDFTLTSFSPEIIHEAGAVCIHAGDGFPVPGLTHSPPELKDILPTESGAYKESPLERVARIAAGADRVNRQSKADPAALPDPIDGILRPVPRGVYKGGA